MFHLPYSLQQINEILKKNGLNTHTARQKTLITQDAKNTRVRFARGHLEANTDWNQVMFSDEKTVQGYANGHVKVRRYRGTAWQEKNIIRTDKRRRIKVRKSAFVSTHRLVHLFFCP